MSQVAAIQMTSGADVDANLQQAAELVGAAAAAGATLIVLPENFALMPERDADRLRVAEEPGRGPVQEFLSAMARDLDCCLVGGTLPLKTGTGDRVRAACLVYAGTGALTGRYDKMHLFDVSVSGGSERYCESQYIEPGNDIVIADSPAGPLGLTVCYDVRFPNLFGAMADRGVTAFALPSAFTVTTGEAHWEVLVRARAIENLSYIIAACQVGQHPGGRTTWGDSMIVDPWGNIVKRLQTGLGYIAADIDRTRQEQLRQDFPVLEHRRLN